MYPDDPNKPPADSLTFEAMVGGLVTHFKELWWSAAPGTPDLGPVYSLSEKKVREASLRGCLDQFGKELQRISFKRPGESSGERPSRPAMEERLLPLVGNFLKTSFGLTDQQVAALRSYGFTEAIEEFVRRARQFDPQISAEDIYQAGRNAWTMHLLQYLMGRPVEATPAILAYSLLYPYTDNYLDDAGIPAKMKAAFNLSLARRLEGLQVQPANPAEQKIFELVGMIEGQYERQFYPQVYASLIAIFAAQKKSMQLQVKDTSPYEADVPGLVFEKGGTAVLADGYLVAGNLTPFEREFSFYYGAFTQLMDDLEDVEQDCRAGIMTMFTQTAGHWPLDALTNRLIVFGNGLLDCMCKFQASRLETLEEIMRMCITPLLIDSASRVGQLYSRGYLHELEAHSPYRFSRLKQVRRNVARRFPVDEILETLLAGGG